jgi:hypothetical protein
MSRILGSLAAMFLAAHAGLGWALHHERPRLGILPPLPTAAAVRAMSFGDSQFLYRSFVLQIQNAGDTGGRFTPMSMYDMTAVVPWLGVLQTLDFRSNHYAMLAVRYFSEGRTPKDLRLLIDFIDRDVNLAPDRKWIWQTQAVALARDKLKDLEYALVLSRKLVQLADFIPTGYIWALQMEPILLADLGRTAEARSIMDAIVTQYGGRMTDSEKSWTKEFYQRL